MLVTGALLALLAAQTPVVNESDVALDVAYFDLVVHPEKYDGKKVSLEGYVLLNKETRNTVFFSYDKTAMDLYRSSEMFYVMTDKPDERPQLFEKLSGKYIHLVAVYKHRCSDAPLKEKENIRLFSGIAGCLDKVYSVAPIYPSDDSITPKPPSKPPTTPNHLSHPL